MNEYFARPQLKEDILAPRTPTEPAYNLPPQIRPQLLADIAESQGSIEKILDDE